MNRAEKRRQKKLAEKAKKSGKPVQSAPSTSEQQQALEIQKTINRAVQLHNAGDLVQAEGVYQQILQSHPEHPVALHLLGVIAHQTGKNEVAAQLIGKALAIKPDYPTAHNNLGLALTKLGKLDEAIASYRNSLAINPDVAEVLNNLGGALKAHGKLDDAAASYDRALAIKPDFAEAHSNLGNTHKERGNLEDAVASYRMAITNKPNYAEAHLNLGTVLMMQGKLDDAVVCFQKAITVKPDYAEAHSNLANVLMVQKKLDDAIASFLKAIALKPDYAEAYNNLGTALMQQGKLDDACACYQKVLEINPELDQAYNNLGTVFKEMGNLDDAIVNYRKALTLNPHHAEAHYNLCGLYEKSNNTSALREAVDTALKYCPASPIIALREAQLLKRDSKYIDARIVLETKATGIAETHLLAERAQILGDLCDRLGDTDAAFGYFRENNLQTRRRPEAKGIETSRYLAEIENITNQMTPERIAEWQNIQPGDDRSAPVFLIGFPRSGTTLLDSILRSHPAITVAEEIPTLQKVKESPLYLNNSSPDDFAKLDPTDLAELRKIYFAELDTHLDAKDLSSIIIDKLPLHIIDVGLIHRMFPEARFIFALRHPCDCVLSCFMQNFKLNDAMANFLDLEDAARLYDLVMTLWQKFQAALPLQVHTVKYENLIDSIEETIAPTLDFFSVNWDDNIKNYAQTARQRRQINTPSYNQVTQPLYTQARGRWERYGTHMKPVLPVLLPWAKRFGYED